MHAFYHTIDQITGEKKAELQLDFLVVDYLGDNQRFSITNASNNAIT